MPKLVVEVADASDLMPKDGHGSSSPFVEVHFDGHVQKTQTKHKDLNPQWNQKFFFGVKSLNHLLNSTVEVIVREGGNGSSGGGHSNFLGRVKISGESVAVSKSEAALQRYPLDKRGLFSNVRGDIALRVHVDDADFDSGMGMDIPDSVNGFKSSDIPLQSGDPFREINNTQHHHHIHDEYNSHKEEKKKHKKEKEVRTFFSVGNNHSHSHVAANNHSHSHSGGGGPAPPRPSNPPVMQEMRADFARAGPGLGPGPAATVMQANSMMFQNQRPDDLVETRPPLAARMRYGGIDKTSSTYDLVEPMQYLYVHVVKARDLPAMDLTGSLDPYVEVKLGNYRGITKHLDKSQNPHWNSVFAFSKERVQSNLIEVIVKDKDFGKDDFVGKIVFDVVEIPVRVPPDSPLAPQWYRLVDTHGGKSKGGEIMVAVWSGTQADEAFNEAWHSDAHNVSHQNLANTRSKVYFSPKLYYLRVHIIEAQDLVPSGNHQPETFVRVQLGHQVRVSRPSPARSINPVWNEELMFVASEPFDEHIMITVDDRVGSGKDEVIGRLTIPVREVQQRMETPKLPDPRWFNLHRPHFGGEDNAENKKKEAKFSSKIHLRLCVEAGYHVLDETTHFSSDLQPSSKHLRKSIIGILELGILSAKNLLPMKGREGRTTDSYCVAKYGNKWVRTRTLLDTLTPRWNEQYTWEVYDPCTIITVGVFDNHHINGNENGKDQRIGKVRIRLSTLETDRVYTHYYPLLVLNPSGLKKHGELQLAIRFTCAAWVNMVAQYSRPLLPRMHYVQPISVRHIDWLRHQAMQIVSARLARAEPPLRRETVEYMLDVDYHMWSLRRSKANFYRIMSLLSGVTAVFKWLGGICFWKNPITTCLVHVLFFILVCYPELILPTIFLYLFVIGLWNYRFRPRHPPHMDSRISQAENTHFDELDEEFDTFPTSKPNDIVRMRYDRMRSVAGRVQTVIGDMATQGERALALLSWRDSRATAIFIIFALIWAVVLYVTPVQIIAVLFGLYWLRHPRFRNRLPSVPVNFFKRLPAKSDLLL